MSPRSRIRHALVLAVIGLLVWPRSAYAYLDPGTGSLVIQTLVAGLAAAGYAFRSTLAKVVAKFRRGRQNTDSAVDRDK